jgi:beta-lactamase class C
MKGKKFLLLALVITVLSLSMVQMMTHDETPAAVAKPSPKTKPLPVNPHLQSVVDDFEKEFLSLLELSHTPGASLAIVKDSTIIFMKGFGVKRIGSQDSVNVNTVFRLGSVSKPFASFLTGILVQDSVLNWNDHVIDYLPSFALKSPEQTRLLSLQNVLSHTTGLPYHTYTNLVEEGQDLPTLLSHLRDVNMSNGVGKEYSYQNVAYSVISEVMKSATGKTYEALMTERVFFPLGMKTASVDYATLMANPNIAYPHLMRRGGYSLAPIKNTYYNVAPAGGINASIDDMAHWMMALLNTRHDVITAKTLDQLFTPVVEAPSKNRRYRQVEPIKKSYYGLGWRVLHYNTDTLIYHGGYVNGYRSEIAVNPKEHIAICVLANAPGGLADNSIPLFFHLYRNRRDSVHVWEHEQNLKRTLAVP